MNTDYPTEINATLDPCAILPGARAVSVSARYSRTRVYGDSRACRRRQNAVRDGYAAGEAT